MSQANRFKVVTDNWRLIADEARDLLREPSIDASKMKTREEVWLALVDKKSIHWVDGWDGYKDWSAWPVVLDGKFIGLNKPQKTKEFLATVPGLQFAAFLNLKSGTTMKSHSHPENAGLLTYHLGLDVPNECYLKTDGRFYSEKNGKGFVFDGTKPHYAFNASDRDRLILHCEFSAR